MSAATMEITEPGLVADMPTNTYLADPVAGGSLSHSGMKTLVNKTPALFAYQREHGRPDTRSFDIGHAAHQRVLGVGPEIVIVQTTAKDGTVTAAANYLTKSAKQHRDDIRAEGGIPILEAESDAVTEMAEALLRHPLAQHLLTPGNGRAEVSAFARDPESGVWLRSRYDWLRDEPESGHLTIVDYKTCADASQYAFAKAAAKFGYDIQDACYSHVAELIGLGDVDFLFVAQEVTPPYLVNVHRLDVIGKRIGAIQVRQAIGIYADCQQAGVWPGYGDEIALTPLPAWHESRFEDELGMVIA